MNSKLVSAVCFLVVLISACSKDDNPPVVEIYGRNPDTMYVKTYAVYPDPGGKATDAEDGEVELRISDNITENSPCNCVAYYNASDNYENSAVEKTRLVKVIKAEGSYIAYEKCDTINQDVNITMSTNAAYDTISLSGFPFSGDVAKMVVKEGGYTIYSQDFGSITNIQGTISVNGSQMSATYTKTNLIGPPIPVGCTATIKKL